VKWIIFSESVPKLADDCICRILGVNGKLFGLPPIIKKLEIEG